MKYKYFSSSLHFILFFALLSFSLCMCAEAATNEETDDQNIVLNIEPWTNNTIPEWAKDLRRGEIITLGSLPFTTTSVTFGYSMYRFFINDFNMDYFPSFLPSSSDEANLDTDEQKYIILSAAAISLAVGIADYIICTIKDKKAQTEMRKRDTLLNTSIIITSSNETEKDEEEICDD